MTITFSKETSSMWENDPEYNLILIKHTERYLNDKLRIYGWIGLYEVETTLGIPKKFETFNPDEYTFDVPRLFYAWVLEQDKEIVFKCFPQTNGDILIDVNCRAYPIVSKEETL